MEAVSISQFTKEQVLEGVKKIYQQSGFDVSELEVNDSETTTFTINAPGVIPTPVNCFWTDDTSTTIEDALLNEVMPGAHIITNGQFHSQTNDKADENGHTLIAGKQLEESFSKFSDKELAELKDLHEPDHEPLESSGGTEPESIEETSADSIDSFNPFEAPITEQEIEAITMNSDDTPSDSDQEPETNELLNLKPKEEAEEANLEVEEIELQPTEMPSPAKKKKSKKWAMVAIILVLLVAIPVIGISVAGALLLPKLTQIVDTAKKSFEEQVGEKTTPSITPLPKVATTQPTKPLFPKPKPNINTTPAPKQLPKPTPPPPTEALSITAQHELLHLSPLPKSASAKPVLHTPEELARRNARKLAEVASAANEDFVSQAGGHLLMTIYSLTEGQQSVSALELEDLEAAAQFLEIDNGKLRYREL